MCNPIFVDNKYGKRAEEEIEKSYKEKVLKQEKGEFMTKICSDCKFVDTGNLSDYPQYWQCRATVNDINFVNGKPMYYRGHGDGSIESGFCQVINCVGDCPKFEPLETTTKQEES